MNATYLVVNGILSNPGDVQAWTDIFEDEYQNRGIACDKFEYFSGAITRFIFQGDRVNKIDQILNRIEKPVVYVGHSNGCDLLVRLLKKTKHKIVAAHLFAAATEHDFEKNGLNEAISVGKLKKLYLYCSKNDHVLKDVASKTSFLRFMGIGYGTLGYNGPKNVTPYTMERMEVIWRNKFGHSDWFKEENIKESFISTLNI